jgi:hypothetical protein
VRCHPTAFTRVGDFLDAVVAAMKQSGFKAVEGDKSAGFEINGEQVTCSLSQTIRRSPHRPTASEERKLERWRSRLTLDIDQWGDAPVIPRWDFSPTDEMSLEIGRWPRPPGATHVFKDSRSRKLEERIDDVVDSFIAHAQFQV